MILLSILSFDITVSLALTVPESVNVNELATLSIKCTLLGGETGATYEWFKDGSELPDEKTDTFEIASINRMINGSQYSCKASANSIGGESNKALVTVNCKFLFHNF